MNEIMSWLKSHSTAILATLAIVQGISPLGKAVGSVLSAIVVASTQA